MAHTKAKGTTKLGRDSESQRLGVKIFGSSPVKCGQIIIRQRGTRYMTGDGVKIGRDDTIYAVRDGVVAFRRIRYTNFTGNKQMKTFVSVVEAAKMEGKMKSEKPALSPRAPRDNRTKSVSPEAMVTGVKAKILAEKQEAPRPDSEKFNPKEAEETMKHKSQGQIIREEELPNIPMRRDKKKVKSKTKNV
jgi:large subunit ribosomal protein L27